MKITLADWQPTDRQKKLVNDVLNTGRLTYGPYTRMLEQKFAKLHNFKYCIFTNSGTSALQIAWHFLKIRYKWEDGDEVIVPAITFVATVNVLLQNRLKPVLVDVDPATFNINPELIAKKITKRTRAICPVDLLGRPVDIEPIVKLARKYRLKIVEDSCKTMFVNHPNEKPVGSEANIACYSSYMAHIISTGVGGFLCTNDSYAYKYLRSMIWHGRDNHYLTIDDSRPTRENIQARFRFDKPGYSYRLTEMEAALGIDELDRAGEIIQRRKNNAEQLYVLLSEFDQFIISPEIIPDNAWMFFPIVCKDKVDRDKFCEFLEKKGIQTRYIMPLINQPIFKGLWNPQDYPVAQWLDKKGFLIGCHQFLTNKDLEYVANCFKEYFTKPIVIRPHMFIGDKND